MQPQEQKKSIDLHRPGGATKEEINLRKFVRAYLRHNNATDAYLELHPNVKRESAGVLGSQLLKSIKASDMLEEMGITDKLLFGLALTGATKATKMEVVKDYGKDGAELAEKPDYGVRHKFLETILKLKKHLTTGTEKQPDNKFNIENATINVVNYADSKTVQVQQPGSEVVEGEEPAATVVGQVIDEE